MPGTMELERLVVRITANATQYMRTVGAVEKRIKRLAVSVQAAGRTMTAALTVPLLGLGVGALKAAADFESSFADVQKTVDATESQFEDMRQEVRRLSTEIPLGTSAINELGAAGGQLGIQRKNIMAFTRTMADMGVATDLVGEEGAKTMARFINVVGESQENVDRLGSTMTALGNNTAATESEIASLALRLGAAGRLVGASSAEVLGLSAALKGVGINAEAGGTAMSRVMKDIEKATIKGGDKLHLLAEVSGMSAEQFKKNWEEDAIGTLITFIEGLGSVSDSGQSLIPILEQLGFADIRVSDSLLRAAGASDQFRGSIELAKKAYKENTALTEEAEKRYATFTSQVTMAWNSIVNLAAAIGEVMMPAAISLVKRIKEISNQTEEWVRANPELTKQILKIAGAVALAGPALIVVGKGLSLIGLATGGVKVLAGLLPALITGFKVLTGIIVTLGTTAVGWIGLIVAGVAGLAAWIVGTDGLVGAWQTAKKWTMDFVQSAIGFMANFQENMTILSNWLRDTWQKVWNNLDKIVLGSFKAIHQNGLVAFRIFVRSGAAILGFLGQKFHDLFTIDIITFINTMIIKSLPAIVKWGGVIVDILKDAFSGKIVTNVAQLISGVLIEDMGKASEGTFADLGKQLGDIFTEEMKGAVSPTKVFKDIGIEAPEFVFDRAKEGKKAIDDVTKAADDAADSVGKLGDANDNAFDPDKIANMKKMKELMEKGKRITEQFRTPQEKFLDRQKELEELLDVGAISVETFNRAMEAARKEAGIGIKVKFSSEGLQGVMADTAELAALAQGQRLNLAAGAISASGFRLGGDGASALSNVSAMSAKANGPSGSQISSGMSAMSKDKMKDQDTKEMKELLRRIAENTEKSADEFVVSAAEL